MHSNCLGFYQMIINCAVHYSLYRKSDHIIIVFILIMFNFGSASEDVLSIRCSDDVSKTITHCSFLQKGQYKLLDVGNEVKTITFDRLTNSKIFIPDNVKTPTIFSSTYDTLNPCDHVIATRKVMIRIDDQDLVTECVSKIIHRKLCYFNLSVPDHCLFI